MVEVVIGRIGRPHGVRGEVGVEVRTDEPERRFTDGAVLRVEDSRRTLTIVGTRWHGEKLLARFEGVDDRTAVEALRGAMLVVDVDDAERPEDEDEFYDRHLVGLVVRDAAGADVGRISDVVHLPAQDLLAIDTATGERLVPFVSDLVPVVDVAGGFVQLADIQGLLSDVDEDEGA